MSTTKENTAKRRAEARARQEARRDKKRALAAANTAQDTHYISESKPLSYTEIAIIVTVSFGLGVIVGAVFLGGAFS